MLNGKSIIIPDARMTRFWVTLQEGIDFVLKNFQRLQGGGTFIPKSFSMKVIDSIRVIVPHLPRRNIGICSGKKMYRVMFPCADSHLRVECYDYYVIEPTIQFTEFADFSKNNCDEVETYIENKSKESSEINNDWLIPEALLEKNALMQNEVK
ncbi:MAG TPA: polysaccharide biosynthesis protein [Sulfuricurvum sp.]|nr:polysaccharide biosynthesis protein [Sulfuricurvum sp.]